MVEMHVGEEYGVNSGQADTVGFQLICDISFGVDLYTR